MTQLRVSPARENLARNTKMSENQAQTEAPAPSEKRTSITDIENAKAEAPTSEVTGLAVVEQGHVIPTTGERKVTTRWEYWSYCLYSELTDTCRAC